MKKNFFYGALAVLSLAACSQDEVVDINRHNDEIKFNVVTNKATRAADIITNAEHPDFKVWANLNTGGAAYFAGDAVTWDEPNSKWTSTHTRYWPDDALNFFAIAGCEKDLTVANGSSASFEYTVESTVASQEDVIYAADINTSKGTDGKVTLNFAHALSQIVFQAKVTNPKLHVIISGVRVAHLNNSGTFTFRSDTGSRFEETQDGTADNEYSDNNTNTAGSWGTPLTGDATYEITFDNVAVAYGDTDPDALGGTDATAMLLMPQTQAAWKKPTSGTATGAFFAIKCVIFNVAGNSYDATNDVALYGTANAHEWLFIPAGFTWLPGQKYIYTFNFGNGNGGFEPSDDDEDEPDPTDPVLVPIEYTVTVDDFDIVSDTDVSVNGENKQN